MLIVRLIRAEDIPMEREATSTYVDVHLLPLNLQSHTFEPYDTTFNVSFRYEMNQSTCPKPASRPPAFGSQAKGEERVYERSD